MRAHAALLCFASAACVALAAAVLARRLRATVATARAYGYATADGAAQALGITHSAFRQRLRRARLQLRRVW